MNVNSGCETFKHVFYVGLIKYLCTFSGSVKVKNKRILSL